MRVLQVDFRIPLSRTTDWSEAVRGRDVLMKLAARARATSLDSAHEPLRQFMLVNAEATRALALHLKPQGCVALRS